MSAIRSVKTVLTNLFLLATAPGTVLHEVGHYAACRMFHIKVEDIALFIPPADIFSPAGRLGYVKHAATSDINPLARVVVSLAPFLSNFMGTLAALFLYDIVSIPSFQLIMLWLAVSFASHAIPSGTDSENAIITTEQLPSRIRGYARLVSGLINYVTIWGPFNGMVILSICASIVLDPALIIFALLFVGYLIFSEALLYLYERFKGEEPSLPSHLSMSDDERFVSSEYQTAISDPESYLPDESKVSVGEAEEKGSYDREPSSEDSDLISGLVRGLGADRDGVRRRAAFALNSLIEQNPALIEPHRTKIHEQIETERDPVTRAILIAVDIETISVVRDPQSFVRERIGAWVAGLQTPNTEAHKIICAKFPSLAREHDTVISHALFPLNNCVLFGEDNTESAALTITYILYQEPHLVSKLEPLYDQFLDSDNCSTAQRLVAATIGSLQGDNRAFTHLDILIESDNTTVANLARLLRSELKQKNAAAIHRNLTAPWPP